MGLDGFWNAGNRANEFLRTGSTDRARDLIRNPGDSFLIHDSDGNWVGGVPGNGETASCHTSDQCPSGYACVNGSCQPMGGGGENQQPSPGQDCDPDDPNSPCNTGGPGACQQTANCGDTEGKDCCGTRCCSFGSAASSRPGVHCWCSKCPPFPTCSDFCTAYLAANGEPGPGCAEGENGNSCDTCSECVGGSCEPLFIGAPCWCEGEECNSGYCEKCETDPASQDYGECAFDPTNCQQCGTIYNHVCPCGVPFKGAVVLPKIQVCKPYGWGGDHPMNMAQQQAAEQCNEICNGDGTTDDPCEPKCVHKVFCTDTGNGVAACPEGTTQSGSLETGEGANYAKCVFCEDCSETYDLPDSCKQCDCNCHNDCPACQLCGADGTCYPDPMCADVTYTVEIVTKATGHYYGYSGPPTVINCGPFDSEQVYLYARGVSRDNLGAYTTRTTTSQGNVGQTVCTDCIEHDDRNDECAGNSTCGTASSTWAVANGVDVPYRYQQTSGCRITSSVGSISTWFYTSGSLEWRFTPEV